MLKPDFNLQDPGINQDSLEIKELLQMPANKPIFQRFKKQIRKQVKYYKNKAIKINPLANKISIDFDNCFDNEDQNGAVYAFCDPNLSTQRIHINIYYFGKLLDNDYSFQEIMNVYNQNYVIPHQIAHILDYLHNGDKPLSQMHDDEFQFELNHLLTF